MEKVFEEIRDMYMTINELSEIHLDDVSDAIDDIIKYKIENERTISEVFDELLSIEFVEDDRKRAVFYKLSNYCKKFNKELANDYNEILEESLSDDIDEDES